MNIIPVIDIKDGQVVSAQHGQREAYCPIQSTLCNTSSIEAVIEGYLSIYPFKTLYIADLNAISNTGNNQYIIDQAITENFKIDFWVDNGIKIENIPDYSDMNYKLIIGSESQTLNLPHPAYQSIKKNILSLDFFPDTGYKGPEKLLNDSALWPEEIIIMTLDRVGKNQGPDMTKLASFCERYPDKNFIAAGGIRDEEDLIQLKTIGINHALVASALHSGEINSRTIKKLISLAP